MGVIYKITNIINNKIYIGKTIRTAEIRWQEHIRESKLNKDFTNIPLYNAFNKYGIENFNFQILEENIPNNLLNQREKKYIKLYNSQDKEKGYNIADGGNGGRIFSKLTEDNVLNIIKILKDENNLDSFSTIGEKFNISGSSIRAINVGESWKQDNISYPIRKYNITGLSINKDNYKKIINDILNSKESLKNIQKKYNLSEDKITSINQGKRCYGNNPYYTNVYNGPFPIRQNDNAKVINETSFQEILKDILFTDISISQIAFQHGIKVNTLQYIVNGKRRKELTKDYLTPLRKFKNENQQIYKERSNDSCALQES